MDDATDWYGPDAATFGDRVAAAREQTGMSQNELAKRLGVRPATLRAWEDDLSEPRANRLSILAGLLNVSMMWLINGEGEGVEAPSESVSTKGNLVEVLAEMRGLRASMLEKAERMGQLEKKLRRLMVEPIDG